MRKGACVLGAVVALAGASCSGGRHAASAPSSTAATSTTGRTTTGGTTAETGTTAGTTTAPGATTTSSPGTTTGRVTTIPLPPLPRGRPGHGRPFLIGTVDDAFEQPDPRAASRLIGVGRRAGFNAIVVSALWHRGLTAPRARELAILRFVAAGAQRRRARPFLLLWNGFQNNTPVTADDREQFALWAAAIARGAPGFRDFIVGNEPNLNTFWMPQFGPGGSDAAAAGYFDLLARTYDRLKAVSGHDRVIGGALAARGVDRPGTGRDTHSPVRFIRDLGRAYRASGRTRPIMDAFATHPYPGHSRIRPDVVHRTSRSITIADYPRLVRLLGQAFDGTPQRGTDLPILYTEFGVETPVPAGKRRWYRDFQARDAGDVVSPKVQARYYRIAFRLAYCQPTVEGLFVFHTYDERDLAGWQSGLYYADQRPKPSLRSFRRTARKIRRGTISRCGKG